MRKLPLYENQKFIHFESTNLVNFNLNSHGGKTRQRLCPCPQARHSTMKNTFALVCAFVLLISSTSFGQSTVDYRLLSNYIDKAVTDFEVPGLAIAIVKDGEVVFSKGFGDRNEKTKQPVDPQSLFGIASISKAFTVASIGMLVEEGKLNWDDKVIQHLPYFQMSDPYITQHMTVRDLLCHRSGLTTFDGDLLWYGSNYTRKEIVQRIQYRPVEHEFRAKFGYQNIMFITAGELIQAVSGQSWDDFVASRIFQPLGMSHSKTSINQFADDENVAFPHLKGAPMGFLNYDNSSSTAAINSDVTDMSKWLNMWLNNGIVDGDTLLSASSIKTILSMHTPLSVGKFDAKNSTQFKGYGLGWFLMDYHGKKVAHHGGGLPGYISKIAMVPEENLGVIILTNDMSSLPTALMYKVIDAHMGYEDRDWAQEFLGFKRNGIKREKAAEKKRIDARIQGTSATHAPAKYTGTYHDAMYGPAEVSEKNGKLHLSLLPSKNLFSGEMTHWHNDTYKVVFNDPFLPFALITFETNADKEVSSFKIDLPNPDFHFYKLDFRKKGQ